MSILVTGFVPFGKWQENTSSWAALGAGEAPGVQTHLLPVEYDRAASMMLDRIAAEGAKWAIAIGMAGTRESVDIESVAMNEDYADLADNAGVQRMGSTIEAGAPSALTPAFPREALEGLLFAKGWPVRISTDCGRFVCNNLFYRVSWGLMRLESPPHFTFVHIPGPTTWDEVTARRFGGDLGRSLGALAVGHL